MTLASLVSDKKQSKIINKNVQQIVIPSFTGQVAKFYMGPSSEVVVGKFLLSSILNDLNSASWNFVLT